MTIFSATVRVVVLAYTAHTSAVAVTPPAPLAPDGIAHLSKAQTVPPPADSSADVFDREASPNAASSLRLAGPAQFGGPIWTAQGPGPTINGQVENIIPDNEVVGAVHVVAPHPTDADRLYLGAVNGGVWMTTNGTDLSPHWTPLTDSFGSLSIGALEFDPTDITSMTLVAGIGRFSSFGRAGGARLGLLRTVDGGATWTAIDGGGELIGKNVSGVKARGSDIIISVDFADSFTFGNVGIFRSTDTGGSFVQVSQGNGTATGLPGGICHDLASDPAAPETMYTSVIFASGVGGVNGVYKSVNSGATWAKVSNAAMDAVLIDSETSNVEIAVGNSGEVYVAILRFGQLQNGGVFRSGDGGASWTAMDIPLTNEAGGDVGTNPRPRPDAGEPGGQGAIHFSIVPDPVNSSLVYVGGDRQPAGFADTGGFPNSIGAFDFSGRLFRGDASLSPGSQWAHLTHSNVLGAPGGGTASSSAPHADSREMAFDAAGNLIEGDDGGIYKRTNAQNNTGDWFSIIGDLQTTEFHSIAYDSVSDIIIGGAQDTGSPEQLFPGSATWNSVSTADGGDVAVDDISTPGVSIRYSSFQFLGALRWIKYDPNNVILDIQFPALFVPALGVNLFQSDPNIQFVQPIELNKIDPSRGLIGTANVYESFDRFENLTDISGFTADFIRAMAYGGMSGGIPNPDVVYFGIGDFTSPAIFLRTSPGGAFNQLFAYPGGTPRGIVLDPDDWTTAIVIDNTQVYRTDNAGASWTNITGDLIDVGFLRTVEFVAGPGNDAVLVGADKGVYFTRFTDLGTWREFGDNLPNAPVRDMEYDATDDALVVGTLGRGAWSAGSVTASLLLFGDADSDGDIDLADHASFADCMAGPGAAPMPAMTTVQSCLDAFDTNVDGDIDLVDAAIFAQVFAP